MFWIPLIGPIIQGITSIFSGYFSTKVEAIKADAQTAQVSEQIIKDTQDDIALRIMRDMIILPVSLWCFAIGYDTLIVAYWPQWMFIVPPFPHTVAYLPYVVLTFLFGNIGLNFWKNK